MAKKSGGVLVISLHFVFWTLYIGGVSEGLVEGDTYGKWDHKSDLPLWARLLSVVGGIVLLVAFIFCYFKCCHRGSRIATEVT